MNTLDDIISRFREEGKTHLANALQSSMNTTVGDYSQSIFSYSPQSQNMDALLEKSLTKNLLEIGYSHKDVLRVIDRLNTRRTIQTSAHTEIAPPQRRFCIDWISTRSLEKDDIYVVGAFSGVPFSNNWRSGRIYFAEQEINFIPKTHQNALVYTTRILPKTIDQYDHLPEKLKKIFSEPNEDEYFSTWASRNYAKLLTQTLGQQVVSFDINRVAAYYLIEALDDPAHPLCLMLCHEENIQKILNIFGRELHFFYSPYETGKYTKQENLYYLDGYGYAGDKNKFPHDRVALQQALRNDELCPGTFLVFTIFAFLNEFQCLGSFVQVEYLSRFKEMILKIDIFAEYTNRIETTPTNTLTTGMFPDNPMFKMLDIVMQDKEIPGSPNDLLKDYYLPIWEYDLYYSNKQAN